MTMIKTNLIALFVVSIANAQVVPIKPDSTISVDSANGDILILTDLTNDEIILELDTELPIVDPPPPPSGINLFTGPNGCTDCIVPENTTFNTFWDVENVGGCTASNTLNHPSWSGTVQPTGGGTGTFQKSIVGGISGAGTFTLNCPATTKTTTTYYKFYYVGQETVKITVPKKTRLILNSHGHAITMLNLIVGTNKSLSDQLVTQIHTLKENLFFGEVYTNSLDDISINITHPDGRKFSDDIKTWFFITENNPLKSDPVFVKNGKCESLDISPNLRLSTNSIMFEDKNAVCILEPEKNYYLTRVYLRRNINNILDIIEKNKQYNWKVQ